jgi:hypothetical protein
MIGEAAMPTNLPPAKIPEGAQEPPPFLATDLLDGFAVAFSILLLTWASQHLVFDYLANPNLSAILASIHS